VKDSKSKQEFRQRFVIYYGLRASVVVRAPSDIVRGINKKVAPTSRAESATSRRSFSTASPQPPRRWRRR
jgi:hypothetical protein